MKFVYLAVILGCLLLAVQNVNAIFGGTLAQTGQHPTQVVLSLPAGRICGGTIVNANHIVTSAHCVLNDVNHHLIAANNVSVRAGITTLIPESLVTTTVVAIFPHPLYSPYTHENDVAVLRTQGSFAFDNNTATPAIDAAQPYLRVIPDDTLCTVAGFNVPTPDLPNPPMFSLQIPVRSRVSCNVAAQHAGEIRDSMLCAGLEMPAINTPAICQSTRGAGLFCSGRFVGVASFGYGCGESSIPGVYTQTRFYNDWIQQQFSRTNIPQPGPTPPPGSSAMSNTLSGHICMFAVIAILLWT